MSHDQHRVLHQVRMYRGLPDSTKDPKGYGAASRQIAAWKKLPLIDVTTRPFRYPPDYPQSKAQEKGIDVQLALDFVMMAVRGEYDVGVLMSNDTDLRPALEQVNLLGTRVVRQFTFDAGRGRRAAVRGRKEHPFYGAATPEAAYVVFRNHYYGRAAAGRRMNCTGAPYMGPLTSSTVSCRMSSSPPSLLVQAPSDSCLAA